jgi:mannose-6-phosphate isomerase-like protein (cupin superfamily)
MDLPETPFVHTTRRVLTVEGEDGKSYVMEDSEPEDVLLLNGARMVRLWQTDEVPARIPVREDVTDPGLGRLSATFAGTRFYTAELPGGEHAPQIPMHTSNSIDYIAVLRGEIVLVTDKDEVTLGPGDTLVQTGNNHTWQNRTDETAVLLVVVVGAERREN